MSVLNVDKIFVLHYAKLEERKKRLDEYLNLNNIDVEYILDFDQEELTKEIIDEWYNANPTKYHETIDQCYKERSAPYREINKAEISCTIKHYLGIKSVAEKCDNYGLVLEDDVIFVEEFPKHFNNFLEKTPSDWGAIFMGCCAGLRVPKSYLKEGVIAYEIPHPASRGGDSYILKKEVAKKIAETMKPFNTISDWELAYQLYLHDVKTYWWEPPLVVQGSETGLYPTTLNDDHHR